MNRKEKRAARRLGNAPSSRAKAGTAADPALAAMFAAAMAEHRAGALEEAERGYRDILASHPNHAETHGMLAVLLFARGAVGEATSHFERIAALKPGLPGIYDDLGKAYMAAGQPELAMQAAARALERGETERRKTFFAHCAKSVAFSADNPRLRKLVLRAFVEGWARPRELARTCVSLLKLDRAVSGAVARAYSAWPKRLSAAELFGAPGLAALADNELLLRLLETDPVTDLGLERLLTNVRYAMLTEATSPRVRGEVAARGVPIAQSAMGVPSSAAGEGASRVVSDWRRGPLTPPARPKPLRRGEGPTLSPQAGRGSRGLREQGSDGEYLLRLHCAVAQQCFINEYVYSIGEAETAQAMRLRGSLEEALAAGAHFPASWLAIVSAYFPLHTLSHSQALFERRWPRSIEALLARQVREPAEERRIAANIPALTGIENETSRAVRQQYEENPYPRWVQSGATGQPPILNGREGGGNIDVLIAGCGTGLSATEFARHARAARILAIDLSLASLAYAKRMAQKFQLSNIEFAQADIMELGSIGRRFDFVDASGVLHHLADPWKGWRILLSLLRNGGVMEVGLYSERARRNVVAGRALIAQRGYRPIAEDIRRSREEIAEAQDGSLLKSLTRSEDFFSMSECRDLLFHPQEHRLSLPDIKAFLAANDLQFAGFVLPPATLSRFALRFPEREAMADLDRWHTFESEAPDTFGGMYLFSVRKPAFMPPTPPARQPGGH